MMRMTKGALSVGGAAIVAVVLILSVPPAARAVAAALVEVTNTASNPVVTQSIGQQGGQLIQISCQSIFQNCNGVGQGGSYTVPPGNFLVITAVDILSGQSLSCTAGRQVSVTGELFIGQRVVSTGGYFAYLLTTGVTTYGSLHATYPSGVVFGPGQTLVLSDSVQCLDTVNMYGYLTAN